MTSGEAEKAGGHNFAELYRHSELAEAADAIVSKFRCGGVAGGVCCPPGSKVIVKGDLQSACCPGF